MFLKDANNFTVNKASTLTTARTINGTSFNGSANITTANWGTARNIYIADNSSTNTGPAVSVNGSGNATLKLPATIKATLSGNASTATKATQDSAGQQINTTYIKGLSVNGRTITYTKGDGTTGSITTQDTNTTYSTGTASTSGLTKLYTGTGTATDGTMTQAAIKSALDGKAASSHEHSAANITSGTLSADRLATSGVTAGSYGPSANATPAHSGTFSVPYITIDSKGRVTAASTKTITLPADNNTDTKVTNTLANTTKAYITGTTTNSTNTGTQVFDKDVYLTANAGELRASTFKAYHFVSDNNSSAPGSSASAIGLGTYALGNQAFASGAQVAAGGDYSHAFGYSSNKLLSVMSDYTQSTTNDTLKALWLNTKFCLAHSKYSFVCGGDNLALGQFMHIEGNNNYGYSKYGHIEGYNNYAGNNPAIHIEGENNSASGSDAHVEGRGNTGSGSYCHVGGYENVGRACQYVFGHYNKAYSGSSSSNTNGYSSLIIGNGTNESARANAFRVDNSGGVFGLKSFASSGADYAEYFEWQDGNINKDDRRGYFVTLDGDKIRIANSNDEYILGIVSGNPAVIGNNDMQWRGYYLFDEFGCNIIEKKTIINDEGEEEEIEMLAINPDLDTEREYIHRSERPEWDTIGMLGVLIVRDDGTCKVNGYCQCNNEGIATASETGHGYRVLKRVNDYLVRVLFR